MRILQWRQIDKADALLVSADERFGRGESRRGLADAARTYNGDQPVPLQ
jgi:hypothetical protein